jgi:hypothetical protein
MGLGCRVRHEDVRASGCIDPYYLDLGTSWRWVVGFTPGDRRLGMPQSRSGRCREEKIRDPTGTRTPTLGRPARSQSLYRLRYPGCVDISLLFPYVLCYHCNMALKQADRKFCTDLAVIAYFCCSVLFSVACVVPYLSPTALWCISDAFFVSMWCFGGVNVVLY